VRVSTPATRDESTAAPERPAELEAWVGLLRAHAAATRRFNRELLASHGLTINDFEVLVHLAHADGGRLRRVDLADRVLLTASGITRLLDGLERSKLVCKASCSADARVTYAEITPAGRALLSDARESHVEGVRALFAERFSADELRDLTALLERLPLAPSGDVCPGADAAC
jgi:DNA-binding MarR family transcriptional regulator